MTIPAGADAGDTVTYDGGLAPATVTVQATVAVTNTFAVPDQTTPAPPGPSLAFSGANLNGLLGDGAALIALGLGLALLGRRRRRQ